MRTDKYYGTHTSLPYSMLIKIRGLGFQGHHNQFRVVCKAKSMTEANKIAKESGLYEKTFSKTYTSETGNSIELEMSDKYGLIVCVGGTSGDKFVDIKEVQND
jgi:hypothetical protein